MNLQKEILIKGFPKDENHITKVFIFILDITWLRIIK